MVHRIFRKTLLALAVIAAPQVMATTLNLSGSPTVVAPIDFAAPLVLTGQASGSDYGVSIEATAGDILLALAGGVTNRATLSVEGTGADALRFENHALFFSILSGGLINEGSLSASGLQSSGIHLYPGTFLLNLFTGTGSFNSYLVNSGTITATGEESSGIYLDGSPSWVYSRTGIFGNLENSGQIRVTGKNAAAIRIKYASITGELNDSVFSGGLINSGLIEAHGENTAGVLLDSGASVSELLNSGSISTSGTNSNALRLDGATILGYLDNQGTLQSTGDGSAALRVSNGSSSHSLTNSSSGQILASGTASRGISIEQGSYLANSNPITVENMGLIQVEGTDSTGVFIDHPTNVQTLINQGDIQATGSNSRGIVVGSGYAADAAAPEALWIINAGTIKADDVAIDISASPGNYTSIYPWTQVDVWGSVTGGSAAIRGNGNVNVNLSGGNIHGDLLGIDQLNADGLIDSTHIEAQRFAIGHVELAQAHSQLTGNLELLGRSALDLNLSRQTDNQRAILAVSGTATFAFNDQIRLKATAQDFRLPGQRQYVLVSANQIIGQGAASEHGLSVSSLSDLLRVYNYQISDTQITAMVGGISTQEAVDYLRAEGASDHALPAYGMFYSAVVGQLDDSDPLFQTFTSSNNQQLLALASQLAPDASDALNQTQSSNLNLRNQTLQNRSSGQRQGLSAGDGLSDTGAWLEVLDSDAKQDSRNGIAGYDADSQGFLLGADGKLNDATTLGLAYSFLDSDIQGSSNKTTSASHALSLLGNWAQNAWFADSELTYGVADNDSTRYIGTTSAKANFDSQLFGASLLGGYSFNLQPQLQLEPRVAARYNRIDIDSYHEKGSSAALAVAAQRYEAGELGGGLRLASSMPLGDGQLKPELSLMAWHDLIADQVSSNSSFLVGGSTFVSNGSDPSRDSYEAHIGVDYARDAITVGLGYDYLGKADYSADTFKAKVRYDF